jgi:rhamnose utilization protein RhaD (predicted bifunctional aldolase and dehydrogenase)
VKNASQPKLFPTPQERDLASLRDLSVRVGSDPLLVQASNGNTSIKLDGILWIKASGKWLAHAMQEEMLVPLELAEVKESIRTGAEIASRYAQKDELRPSIETAMHALLRHRVVIHVHSINAIAWAIRLDAPDQLKERLAGLHWQWIPYAASGIPLAQEIEKAAPSAPEADVLILGNHGLVVCGQDCHTAEKLLREVERRLAIVPRRFPKPDATVLALIARFSKWQLPDVDSLHALGTDAVSRKILKGGVLYPCQAIYLGQTVPLFPPAAVLSKFTERLNSKDGTPPFVAVERSGVMLNEKITSAARANLIGLAQVTLRTDEFARLRYLNEAEVTDVLNKGAHGCKEPTVMEEKANSSAGIKELDEERTASADRFHAGAGSCIASADLGLTPTGQLDSVRVHPYGSLRRKEGHAR